MKYEGAIHCQTRETLLYDEVSKHSSTDLIFNSFKHIFFLRSIHSFGVSHQRPSNESLRRYCDLWLPLLSAHPNVKLIPPPDIAWLWHCHRLAQKDYVTYVKETFGCILEANPPFAVQADDNLSGFDLLASSERQSTFLWQVSGERFSQARRDERLQVSLLEAKSS